MKSPELYSEGCNFIRHYSNCSLTVRIATLVQGLVLLSACAYLILTGLPKPEHLVFVSAFGLVFTGLLYLLHNGYLRAAKEYTKAVIGIEDDPKGPVSFYEERRIKIYEKWIKRQVTINATFTLIGLAFIICFLFSIAKCIWFST